MTSIAGLGYELHVVAAVVVGGVAIFGGSGTVVGAALGALLLNTINQGLVAARISSFWDEAIAGALLLAAISFDRCSRCGWRAACAPPRGPTVSSETSDRPSAGAGMQGARPEAPAETTARQPLWHRAARWEVGLVVVLIGSLIFGSSESRPSTARPRSSTWASTSATSRSWRCR